MATILAVDDSEPMRKMISFILKNAGYDVEEAEDGADALKKAQVSLFDCIVTDINMPNKDGIELIKDLRALPGYKHIPMLVISTDSRLEKQLEAKAAGATEWIVKPFEPEQLIDSIKDALV